MHPPDRRRPPSTPIPTGSRLAIKHFTEYLEQFPDDLEVRWLLNLAHMTLGEYPDKVDPRFLISTGSIPQLGVRHRQVPRRRPPRGGQPLQPGRRRDHGRLRQRRPARPRRHLVRPDRADGFLPQQGRRHLRGPDRGGRRDRPARRAGLRTRPTTTTTAAGHLHPARRLAPVCRFGRSLLRNNGDGSFTDVTKEAGLLDPVNSNVGGLGRLRQRRLARPLRRLRAAAQPPVSQPGRRHLRGGRRQGRRRRRRRGRSARVRPGSTSTTTAIPTCSSTT